MPLPAVTVFEDKTVAMIFAEHVHTRVGRSIGDIWRMNFLGEGSSSAIVYKEMLTEAISSPSMTGSGGVG